MNKNKILIIDDDRELCSLMKEYLESYGYHVESVHNGQDGLDVAVKGDFTAVILDVMLPGMDGFEVLKALRHVSDVPVLMLTSRGDETDRIVGLEIGADDYLPKTFSTRELLARLRAVTRRSSLDKGTKVAESERQLLPVRMNDLLVDPASRKATLSGDELLLTPIEFDLLFVLVKSSGRVLTRDILLERISGRDYEIFDRSIDMHISSLRKKLGDDPKKPQYIKTVRTAGYMFVYTKD